MTSFDALARAFEGLPDGDARLLWLALVEGLDAHDSALRLGVPIEDLGPRAFGARARLRRRFLAEELTSVAGGACASTIERLEAHSLGALHPLDQARVTAHLARCGGCALRARILADLSPALCRAQVAPPTDLPLPRRSATTLTWPALAPRRARWHHVVLGTAAAVLALTGVAGALVESLADGHRPAGDVAASGPFLPPLVLGQQVSADEFPGAPPAGLDADVGPDALLVRFGEPGATDTSPTAPPVPSQPLVPVQPPAPVPPPAEPVPPAPETFQVVATVSVLDTTVALGVGEGACTGIELVGVQLGCTTPSAPADLGLKTGGLLGG